MTGPTISFLVAVRNRPELVCRALRSVPLDDPALEVVVVDDASVDGTPARIEAEFGDSVRLVRQRERRGSGAARNVAARVARGDWAVIFDSDNELLPGAGALLLERVRGAEANGVVFMNARRRSDGTPTGAKTMPDGTVDYRDLLRRRLHGEYIPAVRRTALVDTPYDEMVGRECAGVLWFRIARELGAEAYDAPILTYDDVSANRMSSRPEVFRYPAQAASCHRMMLEFFGAELRRLDPDVWADHVVRDAFWTMVSGDRRRALRDARRALRVSRRPSVIVASLAVVAGPRLARWAYRG